MVDKKLGGAGLRGQSAGETSLCTVGVSGTGLTYRGYDITDLAENTTFEEVAYLIFHGHLPNASELAGYKQKLKENSMNFSGLGHDFFSDFLAPQCFGVTLCFWFFSVSF